MRLPTTLALAVAVAAASPVRTGTAGPDVQAATRATVSLDNSRVRTYRTSAGVLNGVEHGPGVVIWLRDGAGGKAGRAIWLDDVAVAPPGGGVNDEIVIVQPVPGDADRGTHAAASGSKPGDAAFVGMSFAPVFENAHVAVIRARMDVGAREDLHTHRSDTIVVHLSGGEIEDTANGTTAVLRWKPGDTEFEARGSSHSARNISHPVEVVLVVLKP